MKSQNWFEANACWPGVSCPFIWKKKKKTEEDMVIFPDHEMCVYTHTKSVWRKLMFEKVYLWNLYKLTIFMSNMYWKRYFGKVSNSYSHSVMKRYGKSKYEKTTTRKHGLNQTLKNEKNISGNCRHIVSIAGIR